MKVVSSEDRNFCFTYLLEFILNVILLIFFLSTLIFQEFFLPYRFWNGSFSADFCDKCTWRRNLSKWLFSMIREVHNVNEPYLSENCKENELCGNCLVLLVRARARSLSLTLFLCPLIKLSVARVWR